MIVIPIISNDAIYIHIIWFISIEIKCYSYDLIFINVGIKCIYVYISYGWFYNTSLKVIKWIYLRSITYNSVLFTVHIDDYMGWCVQSVCMACVSSHLNPHWVNHSDEWTGNSVFCWLSCLVPCGQRNRRDG